MVKNRNVAGALKDRANAVAHLVARKLGFDYFRYNFENSPALRRALIMRDVGIDTVYDVGAHSGQYGLELRSHGFAGRIVSFEPLLQPFQLLERQAADDENWDAHRLALGDRCDTMTINVSCHPTSSSLLPITNLHIGACPTSVFCGSEEVRVERLDAWPGLQTVRQTVMLKIDVQGYEDRVLAGADETLNHVTMLDVELSLRRVYESTTMAEDLMGALRRRGFDPVSIEPVFTHPTTGHVLQVNVMFVKQSELR